MRHKLTCGGGAIDPKTYLKRYEKDNDLIVDDFMKHVGAFLAGYCYYHTKVVTSGRYVQCNFMRTDDEYIGMVEVRNEQSEYNKPDKLRIVLNYLHITNELGRNLYGDESIVDKGGIPEILKHGGGQSELFISFPFNSRKGVTLLNEHDPSHLKRMELLVRFTEELKQSRERVKKILF
jgi:hypothetical protein